MSLYILCGLPGSGKSTFKKYFNIQNSVWVSRDDIRFNLLSKGEDYFAHEDTVYDIYIQSIQQALEDGKNVIADATQLNKSSRLKLLCNLDIEDLDVFCINFDIPIEVCKERNNLRKGRRKVPEDVIDSMSRIFKFANYEEYNYSGIGYVDENNRLKWSIKSV